MNEETKISAVLTVEGLRKFSSDMNTAADAVDKTGDRGVAAGGKLKKAMTAGFLAAGAAAILTVKKFASFDDALNRVQINSGASATQMVKLEKVARKMGEKFPASAVEVAEAMNEILKAGMSVEDMLAGGLENALAMATAEGMAFADAGNTMSNAMNTFGIAGKNANVVAAALSNVASKTSADVNDLALSLGQVGGTADTAGWSISQTTAALGILIQRGLTGSKAGTSLNNMLTRMMSAGGEAKEAMHALGIEVYDSQGRMKSADKVLGELAETMNNGMTEAKRNGLLFKAFGIDGLDAARNLGKAREEVRKLTVEAQKVDAPVQKARDQMKSLGMQLDTTQESIGNMAMQVGAALSPAVSAALPYVQNMAAAIGDNADAFANAASGVGQVAMAFGSVLAPALQTVGGLLGAMSPDMMQASAAVVALTGAFYLAAPAITSVVNAMRMMSGMMAVQTALSGATGAMGLFAGASGAASIGVRSLTAAMMANPLFLGATAAVGVVAVVAALRGISSSGASEALQTQRAASDTLKTSFDTLKGSIDGVISAQLMLQGSSLAVQRAKLTLAQATARVTQLEKDGKKGSDEYKSAVLSQKEALLQVKTAKENARKATNDFKASQAALAGEAEKVADALKTSSKTYSETKTQIEAIADGSSGARDDLQKLAQAFLDSGGDLNVLKDASGRTRRDFQDLAKQFDSSKSAMDKASGKAQNIEGRLDLLGGSAGTASDEIADMRAELDKLDGKTVTASIVVKKTGNGASSSNLLDVQLAGGGRVFGPGTGTSDSVPAMLSAGEFVLTARQARGIGYANLNALPKFAKGGAWFKSQASAASASMRTGSAYWKAQQRAGVTEGLGDDRKVAQQQIKALKSRLATIKGESASGSGDKKKENVQARAEAIREVQDSIRELQAQSWQIKKIGIPGAKKDKAAAQQSAALAAVGAAGSALWKQTQSAGATETLTDDLAALRARVTELNSLKKSPERAQAIADTEAEIWTLLNVTAPQQQAQAVQDAINAVGGKGSDLWKKESLAGVTETLDDDLAVMRERLAALQKFGSAASSQIADAEADIWTMLNITMPAQTKANEEQAKQQQAQADAWRNEAAMALGRGFYSASGGAGGGSNMGITDTSGGDASGVGHAPRPEIDRVWLAGVQLNDLDARSGNGVEVVEILGWDEAEDFESTRSKRADGDALGGTRDGSVKVTVKGRLTGDTYQDYHERRRALKAKVRAAVDETLLKVPDVTYGDEATDYPSSYSESGMAGMERRTVRLTSNLKWGEKYGKFGSLFEFELRSPHRFVEADVAAEAPLSDNGAALTASAAARTSILAIRGEIAASPAMDDNKPFEGTSAQSVIRVVTAATVDGAEIDELGTITVSPPALAISGRPGEVLPIGSADISNSQPLLSQDSYDIDTIAGTATPIHRTPLARLIGGNSFIAAMIPMRSTTGDGPTDLSEIVAPSLTAADAVQALYAGLELSSSDVVNESASGVTTYAGLVGDLTATSAQVATGMPGWRAKRSGADFSASSFVRKRIDTVYGEPKSRPMLHVVMAKPAASWSTVQTALDAFGTQITGFAHLLTLEVRNAGISYIHAAGFNDTDGSGISHANVRYDNQGTDAWRLSRRNAAMAETPDPANHVWVAAILDAGVNVWTIMALVDIDTGVPVDYIVTGGSMFDAGATEEFDAYRAGVSGSLSVTGYTSGTRAADVAYPVGAERYIGCGSESWAGSVAGAAVSAAGMGAIVTLDAVSELATVHPDGTDLLAALTATPAPSYSVIGASIAEWIGERFAPQSIRRAPVALETEWTDRVPDLHGDAVVRLDSVVTTDLEQLLGVSRSGALSTEQMAVDSYADQVAALAASAHWRHNDLADPTDAGYDSAVLARSDKVAIWNLGDASGAPQDSSGNARHYDSMQGNPTYGNTGPILGSATGCIDFDGTGDYALRAFNADVNPANYTIAAWVKRDFDSGAVEIIYSSRSASGLKGFQLRIDGSDKAALLSSNGAATVTSTGTTTLTTGIWHFLVGTCDGVTQKLYVNGVLEDSDAVAYVANDDNSSAIGAAAAGTSLFQGKIGRVSLHNAAMTVTDIAALFVKGRRLIDAMGSYHGGMVGSGHADAAGAITDDTDRAIDYNGTDDRSVVPYSAVLNAATFSISGWIKRDTDSGGNELIIDSRDSTGATGYAVVVSTADKLALSLANGGAASATAGATSLAADTWYHIAATYDGTTSRVYLNGVEDGSGADALTVNASGPTRIGCAYNTTNFFPGKIDELSYHANVVLNATEILSLYTAGLYNHADAGVGEAAIEAREVR